MNWNYFFDILGLVTIFYFFFVYSFAYYRTNRTIIRQRAPVNSVAFILFAIGSTLGATNAFHAAYITHDWGGSFIAGLGYFVLAAWGIATVITNEIIKRKIHRDVTMHSAWQDMIDYTEIPVSLYDKFGKPIIWNKALVDLTGYTHKEVVTYWQEHREIVTLLYQGEELERVKAHLESLGDGYSDTPFTLTTKDGNFKTIHWTTRPYYQGTIRKGVLKPIESPCIA